jgi:hypothetical protein
MNTQFKAISKLVALGMFALAVVGCDAQTKASLCDQATGPMEGLIGDYELNDREVDTFGVKTQEIHIGPEVGKKTYSVKFHDDDEEGFVACNINGRYILEGKDEKTGGYLQIGLYVSQVGLHINPLFYDKVKLDAAGIPNSVVLIPEGLKRFIGGSASQFIESLASKAVRLVSDDEENKLLFIDNTGVEASKLLENTKPYWAGMTLFRK